MNNKGQFSSAFNYVFALILGGIVFAFLIGFAYQFIAFSGSLTAAETVVALNDEFAAFSVSSSAEKVIDYGQDFDFTSYQGSITSGGQTQTMDQIVFSPLVIEGEVLYVATKSLELPYRVSNLFYLADGKTVYIFVYDDATKDVVQSLDDSYASFPRNFPQESFSIEQIESSMDELELLTAQYEFVRFVFFTDYDSVLNEIQSRYTNYDILFISSTEDDYSFGEVQFPDGSVAIYLDYPLLIGAITSFDANSYTYNLELVLDKLEIVTTVYYDKAKFVSTRLPTCDYDGIKVSLNNYRSFIGDTTAYNSYQSKSELVEEANDVLGGDCPEVF